MRKNLKSLFLFSMLIFPFISCKNSDDSNKLESTNSETLSTNCPSIDNIFELYDDVALVNRVTPAKEKYGYSIIGINYQEPYSYNIWTPKGFSLSKGPLLSKESKIFSKLCNTKFDKLSDTRYSLFQSYTESKNETNHIRCKIDIIDCQTQEILTFTNLE